MIEKTYKNRKGNPIIRKCSNCKHFEKIPNDLLSNGYCKAIPLMFAFTHHKSVYAIVKEFYACENHELVNEEELFNNCEQVDLLSYLLDRNAKKKL
jgi:hypothetical protein